MARKGKTDFGALIQAARAPELETSQVSVVASAKGLKSKTLKHLKSQTLKVESRPKAKASPVADPSTTLSTDAGTDTPKFKTLTPKLVLFRDDQLEALTRITRRLSRAKRGGERITENTLVRAAVDALIARGDNLEGSSEDEIRQGLEL